MNRCPITYQSIDKGKYSELGLMLLHRSLKVLEDLPYSAQEQRQEAARRMKRMSIQGVQPKISAVLNIRQNSFELVDINGRYIIKPQSDTYQQLPENEDVTMRMAKIIGIEIPLHGMIYGKDHNLSYFIKRFDREGRNKKIAVEDFAQLAGKTRDTKYDFTTEKLIKLIEEFCTFPFIEKVKFFRLLLFSFLVGNEDMHLKNFSLITRNNKVELSPAYDLLNSTMALGSAEEELALSLAGKKRNFKKKELIDYLGKERLQLNDTIIKETETVLMEALPKWKELISISFLSNENKKEYLDLLKERFSRIKK